ncbi:helix-turn-helix domain-containing protein [Paenibacillus ginsengarvi]|uniref:helix-turn-helix domain-containing protein n=1 Tax=Paenibacillus ginsengarvi TaxID=400777 RepID=UPI0013156CC1|nr:helix-turn-helix domain-containing protein [Paenibacillus ginsengarvi]
MPKQNDVLKLDELPDVLTAQEIACFLRVDVRRVYDNLKLKPNAGGIPHVKMGKQMRIYRSDFISWMDKQRGGAA